MNRKPAHSGDSPLVPLEKPLIGISMGDPAGIGSEVIVKALADATLRARARFLIYGTDSVLAAAADAAEVRPFWFRLSPTEPRRVDSGVAVIDFDEYPEGFWVHARPTTEGGKMSLVFLDEATSDAREGALDALVTGPINKTSWRLAGCRHPGHTERLAAAFPGSRVAMAFFAGPIRVALASSHVGLFELRNQFNIGLVFQPIDLLHDALRRWLGLKQPRIAVAGLNPHAGEDGAFGDEERRVIEPAMQMARNVGIDVEGPLPPDTLFTPQVRARFDGMVAMYHDQGLAPLKALAFDSAVNVTLGLPIIRTSVDHGTAFDIAGANSADPGSMKSAIRLACDLVRSRADLTRTIAPLSVP